MKATMQKTMRAAAIDRFGGIDEIRLQELPVPRIDADEILIRVEAAGVGVWDPYEREGGFAEMTGRQPRFPYVMGVDGAGVVVTVGRDVRDFAEGDRVWAMSMASPKGGFYAQYAAVKASDAAVVPDGMAMDQAGAMPADAITALTGLDEVLNLSDGQKVLILGAGGGIGHMAVQLAKRMGAAVLAVASGDDGVQLAGRLGADVSINGRSEDIAAAARRFAPDGLDAALLTAGGPAAEAALSAVRPGGRAAYPNGVEPVPGPREGISVEAYDGRGDPATIQKLTALIEAGPFHVHVARTFPLERAADAHRALETHYLGKLVLLPW